MEINLTEIRCYCGCALQRVSTRFGLILFEATFAVFQKMRVPVSLKETNGNNNEKMRKQICAGDTEKRC